MLPACLSLLLGQALDAWGPGPALNQENMEAARAGPSLAKSSQSGLFLTSAQEGVYFHDVLNASLRAPCRTSVSFLCPAL